MAYNLLPVKALLIACVTYRKRMKTVAEPIRIFICYKKLDSDGRENNSAFQLYQFLREVPNYKVWMDEGLDAGILWEKTIYEELISSQVVILAVGNGTSKSEWVRRELSVAMSFGMALSELCVGFNQGLRRGRFAEL